MILREITGIRRVLRENMLFNGRRMKFASDERVCIFVDGENLFYSQKREGIEVDYLKLKEVLAERRKLIRPYYYGTATSDPRQQRFFDLLRHAGYEVKVIPLMQYENRRIEKGMDVMLVTDMLVLAHRDIYDVAILVAGDRDYLYAVKALKEAGKRVEVASFDDSCSRELSLTADKTISLTRIAAMIRLRPHRHKIVAGKATGGEEQEVAAFNADLLT